MADPVVQDMPAGNGTGPALLQGDRTIPLLDTSVGERLRQAARLWPEQDALLWAEGDGLGRLGFAALLREAERVAAFLLQRTVPGDRVAVWSRNSLEWIALEYGSALAGTVIVAWNTAWTDRECLHARAVAQPRLMFAGCDVRGVDLLGRARLVGPPGAVFALDGLRALVRDAAPPASWPPVPPEAPFLMQFTSGTTGQAKAAVLTHRAALNAAWLRARLYGVEAGEVWLNPVPMTHVGGAITMLLGAMATGGAYVLMPRFEAAGFVRLLGLCGATRIGGVPTMLIAALEQPGWQPGGTVRSIGLGGTQVPAALVARLRDAFGAPVVVTYGQSECPLATSTLPDDPPEAALRTVGRPMPHVTLRICDPQDGRPLRVGEVGEIQLRAPLMLDRYHGAPEATAHAFTPDGFLRTGDLGLVDGDGRVSMQGRARDVIMRGGENIYPAEVEEVLMRHPGVAQVAVVGIADARWGQVVGAVVVTRGPAVPAAALEEMAAAGLAHFKVPRRWRFVDGLPMTASGKVRKIELEALFADGAA